MISTFQFITKNLCPITLQLDSFLGILDGVIPFLERCISCRSIRVQYVVVSIELDGFSKVLNCGVVITGTKAFISLIFALGGKLHKIGHQST
jgi:hypothetical protein